MEPAAWRAAGVAALMAVWWVSEAVPLPATALVPLVLFPPLGLASIGGAAAPYANPVIFLFLGGFILAAALSRSGLHRRIALGIVTRAGGGPRATIAGFMAATAFLSMWVSNTATVLMMLPIALSVLALDRPPGSPAGGAFPCALLLGIAYAANIGGMATLIGTPPNALLAGFLDETYGMRLGFLEWMLVGLPLVAVALPLAWAFLARGVAGEVLAADALQGARAALGATRREERLVGAVAATTAAAWIGRPLLEGWIPALSDAGIAIAGSLALFVLTALAPRRPALVAWDDVETLPWGVLILFGGGLSLASVIQESGLAAWIGDAMAGSGAWPALAVVATVTAGIVFLTELTSNTATAATFLPVAAAVGVGLGVGAFPLAAAVALAASAAFMMPVATPPNAVVYGSGLVPIGRMVRAGLVLNLVLIVLITAVVWLLAPAAVG